MIVSLNRRFVFVHIHKCAGTSIEVAMAKSLRHNDIVLGSTKSGEKNQEFLKKAIGLNKHSTAQEARQFLGPELYAQFFTFAFVRHPIERLHSLYTYTMKMVGNSPLTDEEQQAFDSTGKLPKRSPYMYKAVVAAMQSASFNDFVLHPLTWEDPGSHPQWRSVTDADGKMIVNYIGKVETIATDFASVCERLGMEAQLEIKNASKEGAHALPPLSQVALDTLMSRYAKDFDHFQYPKSLPVPA